MKSFMKTYIQELPWMKVNDRLACGLCYIKIRHYRNILFFSHNYYTPLTDMVLNKTSFFWFKNSCVYGHFLLEPVPFNNHIKF